MPLNWPSSRETSVRFNKKLFIFKLIEEREKAQSAELRTLLDSQGNQTTQIAEKVDFYARREKELEARIAQMTIKLATSVDDNAAR